jgi:hypothetical protein
MYFCANQVFHRRIVIGGHPQKAHNTCILRTGGELGLSRRVWRILHSAWAVICSIRNCYRSSTPIFTAIVFLQIPGAFCPWFFYSELIQFTLAIGHFGDALNNAVCSLNGFRLRPRFASPADLVMTV